MSEPTIIVNNHKLTEGQAMTLRVALTSWLSTLDNGHKDELGPIGELYHTASLELIEMMFEHQK